MEQKELARKIVSLARSMGIVDVGFADVRAWDDDKTVSATIPKCSSPSSLMGGARSVIVIGIPMQMTILATAPSVYYSEHYRTVNSMLDHAAQRIAMELHIEGHHAVYVSRTGIRA